MSSKEHTLVISPITEGLFLAVGTEAFRYRIVKEAFHELGHTFNLRHCPDAVCVMHYGTSLEGRGPEIGSVLPLLRRPSGG